MVLYRLASETSWLAGILHFNPVSFCFPEEGQLPPLAPKGVITLSLHLLEELLLCKQQGVLQILISPYIKYESADDPRLMNVDDVDIVVFVEKGNRLDGLTVDYFPRLFVSFYDKNGKNAC